MSISKIAYISFDVVPSPKGAAIHIAAFSKSLAVAFGQIQLITVSPSMEKVDGNEFAIIEHIMLPAIGNNLIYRVLYFRNQLQAYLQDKRFAAIHIRSIYEGYLIALNKQKYCDYLIFEVNGLPSIELKYRYPNIVDDKELMYKLLSQENICLQAADLIITPSSITQEYLQTRGIPAEKIQVIPNGVDLEIFTYSRNKYDFNNALVNQEKLINEAIELLYFGTLSPWQGVNLAVEALGLLNRDINVNLTIIGQARDYQVKDLKRLASKLGVIDNLNIIEPLSQSELVRYIHAADMVVAPLMPNDRNLIQGCCPLKVIEAMATGIPVIASDLPVVRELGCDGEDFLLVKPGSAKAIKNAVLRLHADRELSMKLANNARQQVQNNYTWEKAGDALVRAYRQLLGSILDFAESERGRFGSRSTFQDGF